jgi:hypothetical protein
MATGGWLFGVQIKNGGQKRAGILKFCGWRLATGGWLLAIQNKNSFLHIIN